MVAAHSWLAVLLWEWARVYLYWALHKHAQSKFNSINRS